MQNDENDQTNHRAQARRLESEMFSLQADRSRLVRKRDESVDQVRRLIHQQATIRVDLDAAELDRVSAEKEVTLIEDEIARAKKKLNAL